MRLRIGTARFSGEVVMSVLLHDLRFGGRQLGKSPGFALAVIMVLALGIGANTTIFSVINALLFAPMPFRDAERIVFVLEGREKLQNWNTVSAADFTDWKSQNQVFEEMALFQPDSVNLAGRGDPERIAAVRVSGEMVPLLGIKPALGRAFMDEEFNQGKNRVVLLSHALWERQFGSGSQAVGESIVIDGLPHLIAGVLPAAAKFALITGVEPDVLMPVLPNALESRSIRNFVVLARLRQGVSLERARSDMNAISRRLQQQYPETNAGWTVWVDTLRGSVDPAAYILLAILIASVLGIACTNVTNLLLAKAAGRVREISIRAALGASRMRILRQLMTENLLLTLLGAFLGMVFSVWACQGIRAIAAGTNVAALDIRLDQRVLGATLMMFLLAGAVVGLLPAVQAARLDLNRSLKEGGSGSHSSPSKRRLRNALVISEIALSMILLAGAGLAIKSWMHLWQIDPGYRPQGLLTMSIALADAEYPREQQRIALFGQLLARLERRSGLRAAAVTTALPTLGPAQPFAIEGSAGPAKGGEPVARFAAASPSYFETMAIPLKLGRTFTRGDSEDAMPVAVISETMARRYWPARNAIGSRIRIGGVMRTIIGIVGDLKSAPLNVRPFPEIYVPYVQAPGSRAFLVIRAVPESSMAPGEIVKREIRALNPRQPATNLRSMNAIISSNMGVIQLGASLLGLIAAGALILTAVGLYGVLAYTVSQQTAEIGVRIALGARPADVLKMVLGQGLKLVMFGVVPGLAISLALGRILASRIHGVNAVEPGVLSVVAALLLIVTLMACYFPARRATRVDPIQALRGA
jgi:putative ABC transport system permease protein